MCEKWEIKKEDIFIVPGNHDALVTEQRSEAIEKINKNIENDIELDVAA